MTHRRRSRRPPAAPAQAQAQAQTAESAPADATPPWRGRELLLLARERQVLERERAADAHARGSRPARRHSALSAAQIAMLQQANANLVIASMEAVTLTEQVQQARNALLHQTHHDALTGLPNRVLLRDRLRQAIELAGRGRRRLAVMFLDLDRFKTINDSLGHGVGDLLLQLVARRLVGFVRRSDTVSRQGGDEFVLMFPEIEQADDAGLFAQKILLAMAAPHLVEHHALHVGVSIGIGIYPDDGADADSLIRHADTAMYHAKENGRNTYCFFEPAMNTRAVLRQSTEASLRLALARQEFVLHYQPKIDLASGTVVGVEALVRWQHPQRGLLAPAEFVPIAEECGLILPLGRWVLRQACWQAQDWHLAGWPPMTMAVNASPLEFGASDFVEHLRSTLAETGLAPGRLEIELTEGVLMRDASVSGGVLQAVAELGVKLAIDDFGTGYSSLSYLSQFPIHTLKIDQSFVSQIGASAADATIVSAVIGMGKSLRKRVIAEGVETAAQCAFLRHHDCDEGQGFLFGRPMTADAIALLLRAGPRPCELL
ncbi:putative bifunctional diguanylate cyclase/phosphodiesterase [Rugamonas rubra]|uniref:Diguanylate cyclase (GGDEF) domain-containing protein n=1 Tax=Rugamonas rubra TaxID=758825 RepID=A0A1I4ND81_9BURK|nr:EAL domain-containing protein [Rugamonas rubra]SFM13484.1 diguanylate cyclase (GGDEF) domain-containing protein [Rugamonas rubra]